MGTSLFLVALMGHYARQSRWEANGVDYPFDVGYEVVLAGAALSVVLVSLAVAIPSVTVDDIREWVRRLPRSRGDSSVIRVVSGSQGSDSGSSARGTVFAEDQILAPGLPRRHLLGSGPELSQQVVMVIYADQGTGDDDGLTPVPSEPALGEAAPRYYWRSLTYDAYTGRGWITRRVETQEYQAGSLALFRDPSEPTRAGSQTVWAPPPGRQQVRAKVWAAAYLGNLLHAAGDLVTVDRAYRVAWRSQGDAFGANILLTGRPAEADNTPTPDPDDARLAQRAGLEGRALVYHTDSLVPAVGEAQLRAVGGDYPSWVQARYLALPEKIPARVSALARDLTATAPTPYDRALAIEAYLRTFPYNLDLPPPPNEQDVVDYFLFDLQQGYCDYYATAMVVLARTAGLPARLAMGYASGTYNEANARYIVTEADAHAWVEIYFPGYGWIEFEPTAGRPPIHRPAHVTPVVPSGLEPSGPMITEGSRLAQLWWLGLSGMVLFLGLSPFAWMVIDGWRLRRMPSKMAVAVVYWRLNRLGRRLVGPVQPGATPYEFAAFLVAWLTDKAQARYWSAALMPAVREAGWLTDLYVRTCYGPQPPDVADQRQAIRIWQRLRRRLWLGRALGR
jgi:transglutaminase-like putative cysteine protease